MILIRKVKRKLIFFVIAGVIIFFILAAAVRQILIEEGTWKDDERGNPTSYTGSSKISGKEGIIIDKDEVIEDALLKLLYTEEEISNMTDEEIINTLQMEEKLGRKIKSLSDCTNAEILWCLCDTYRKYLQKPEDLEKLLNAELITQYPKIEGLPEDKLNGIVEFERHETDPDTGEEKVVILKYIEREVFNEKFDNYVMNGDKDILNYFTLDDNGNLIIATWGREEGSYWSNNTALQTDRKKIRAGMDETKIKQEVDPRYTVTSNTSESISATYIEYTITEKCINYKSLIQQYTLPFEYLWSLLVMGRSDEFVLELSDLIYGSEIKIGIFDNINKTIVTNIERYTEDFKDRNEKWEKNEGESEYEIKSESPLHGSVAEDKITGTNKPVDEKWSNGEWLEETYDYEHTNIITNYEDNIQVQVIHAKTWIVNVDVPIENTMNNEIYKPDRVIVDDNGWTDKSNKNTYREERKTPIWIDPTTMEQHGGETYYVWVDKRNYKYERTLYHGLDMETDTTKSKYQLSPATIIEKTDIDEDTDNNFVKCLRKDQNAYTYLTDETGIMWLTTILQNNQDTISFVDLTKYLLQKAKHPDDTSLTFDFSIYDVRSWQEYSEITGGASYNSLNLTESDLEILYKITSAERGGGTQQQQEYVVSVILNRVLYSGFPNTVYGVVFQPMQFQPTRNGAYERAVPSQTTIDAVNNVVANGDTTNGALYFMTPGAALGQQSWLKNCEYLFNDVSEDLKDTNTGGSHNFYTTAAARQELSTYSSIGSPGVAPKEGSSNEKLNFLFPNGLPTTEAECNSYIVKVPVALTTKSGQKTIGTIRVHKDLAADVQNVFQKAQDAGFKIYEAAGYSYRKMNNGSGVNLSHHSYGVAIDINVKENYSHRGSIIYAGQFWDPSRSEFSIPRNGALVKAFETIGWKWGGNWSGNYQDYMHFSYTGK